MSLSIDDVGPQTAPPITFMAVLARNAAAQPAAALLRTAGRDAVISCSPDFRDVLILMEDKL